MGQYKIEVLDDNAIKRKRKFFDLMQQTFNFMNGLIIYVWKMSFDIYNQRISIEEAEYSVNWKTEQRRKGKKQKKWRYI